jgi:hypothetical protein
VQTVAEITNCDLRSILVEISKQVLVVGEVASLKVAEEGWRDYRIEMWGCES